MRLGQTSWGFAGSGQSRTMACSQNKDRINNKATRQQRGGGGIPSLGGPAAAAGKWDRGQEQLASSCASDWHAGQPAAAPAWYSTTAQASTASPADTELSDCLADKCGPQVQLPSSNVHTPDAISHLQGVSRMELASLARGRGGGLCGTGRSEWASSSRSAATTLRGLEPRLWRLECCSGVLGLQRSGVSALLGGWEGERSWELDREWEREGGRSWEAEREWEANQDPPSRWAALLVRCRGQGGERGHVWAGV